MFEIFLLGAQIELFELDIGITYYISHIVITYWYYSA